MLQLGLPQLIVGDFDIGRWKPQHAQSLVDAWDDPTILIGSTPPADRSLGSARRWIEGTLARADAGVAIDAVITTRSSGEVCGEIGLSSIHLERRAALIGWWVAAPHRGTGTATAAVTAFGNWALSAAGFSALLAEIAPGNQASIAVAERAGFRLLRAASGDLAALYVRR